MPCRILLQRFRSEIPFHLCGKQARLRKSTTWRMVDAKKRMMRKGQGDVSFKLRVSWICKGCGVQVHSACVLNDRVSKHQYPNVEKGWIMSFQNPRCYLIIPFLLFILKIVPCKGGAAAAPVCRAGRFCWHLSTPYLSPSRLRCNSSAGNKPQNVRLKYITVAHVELADVNHSASSRRGF